MMDRNGYRPSLLQEDHSTCFICQRNNACQRHEIFGGAFREKSKHDGLWVTLCDSCHLNGPAAVHRCRETAVDLKRKGERAWLEEYNKCIDEFIDEYGGNYL